MRSSFAKIVEIANRIELIEKEIEDPIAAVANAVKEIERAQLVNEMRSYRVSMKRACSSIKDQLAPLNGLAPADNNLQNATVQHCISVLSSEMAAVNEAILQFAAADAGADAKPPTLQTYFSCSASVGMWAQAYQMVDAYYPTEPPVYASAQNGVLQDMYKSFFAEVDRIVTDNEPALYGPLLIPKGVVCRSVTDHFEMDTGEIHLSGVYLCAKADPGQEPKVLNVLSHDPIPKWVPENLNSPAALAFSSLLQRRAPIVQRLSDYSPVLQTAEKTMSIFRGAITRPHKLNSYFS